MVMLVWWILSLCGVCEFTWLPVVIDIGISMFFAMITEENALIWLFGPFIFALCKVCMPFNLSGWWILLSPVWFVLAFLVPGGFTITNIIFNNLGFMDVPTWAMVVSIISDIVTLGAVIALIVTEIRDR